MSAPTSTLAGTKEPAMTAASAHDPMVPLLTDELYTLLTRDRLVEGVNLLLTR